MSQPLGDVFADTTYWVGLVVKQDQHHHRAQRWSLHISGRIITTTAVLLETANALARPGWRMAAVSLLDRIQGRSDIEVAPLSQELWSRGCELYRNRQDKRWSLTDCMSFVVMQSASLRDALSADEDFRQAGFRPVLLDDA